MTAWKQYASERKFREVLSSDISGLLDTELIDFVIPEWDAADGDTSPNVSALALGTDRRSFELLIDGGSPDASFILTFNIHTTFQQILLYVVNVEIIGDPAL